MFPSGVWEGFWQQQLWGRQPMSGFHLHFRDGTIDGHGFDMVGRFLISGDFEISTGRIRFEKQYIGRHNVQYEGYPDGEGAILGTWTVTTEYLGQVFTDHGPFGIRPVLPRPTGEEPSLEIGG
jgi:hypothetical protein